MTTSISRPAPQLMDPQRARRVMGDFGVDLLCTSEDSGLTYVSGHASDSSLCHFYDEWACAVFPRDASIAGTLFVPDYDLAYQVTRPTCLPELRAYGSDWSSAASVMKEIHAGVGVETELRQPLRDLFARTRPTLQKTLGDSIKAYITEHFGSRPVSLACDDLRFGQHLREMLGEHVKIVDARPVLRRIRAVKTANEIACLQASASINDRALRAASRAIGAGRPWRDMVLAYRDVLAREGAKPLGERGMLFNGGPDGGFVLDHDYIDTKTFRQGETVLLDAICQYRLYHADMARTAVIGEPSPMQTRMHRAVAEALAAAEGVMRPGVHTKRIEETAAEVLRKQGFNPRLTTLVCHPIGLEIFDYPNTTEAWEGWVLEESSVINFEVFYRDATEGGMHLEDSVLVTQAGAKSLSGESRDLIIA